MFDTIWISLDEIDVGETINFEEIRKKLISPEKYKRENFKPTGLLRNMAVFLDEERKIIRIRGSIAKYWNRTNVLNFDLRLFRGAIIKLSNEIGVDLSNGKVRRIDVGFNFELLNPIPDYFPALYYLKYHQRDSSKKTTLRFYGNSVRRSLIFYDKIEEFAKKNKELIKDDTSLIDTFENLMRYELMLQSSPAKLLRLKELRVKDLYKAEVCKKLLIEWRRKYEDIHKRALFDYPNIKGLGGFDNLMRRYLMYDLGRETINSYLLKGVEKGLISSSGKSKKLKQFDDVLKSDKGFKFKETTKELNHKIKVMYVEGLKQIFKMKT